MTADRSDAKIEEGGLTLFLTADDALLIYKLLNGYVLVDGSGDRLSHLIYYNYEGAFEKRLTEPWEWDDD